LEGNGLEVDGRRERGRDGKETGKEDSFGERMVETKRDEEKKGVGKEQHHSTRFVEQPKFTTHQ
jgi:hypothetical protein